MEKVVFLFSPFCKKEDNVESLNNSLFPWTANKHNYFNNNSKKLNLPGTPITLFNNSILILIVFPFVSHFVLCLHLHPLGPLMAPNPGSWSPSDCYQDSLSLCFSKIFLDTVLLTVWVRSRTEKWLWNKRKWWSSHPLSHPWHHVQSPSWLTENLSQEHSHCW